MQNIDFFLIWSFMSVFMIIYVLKPLKSYQIRYKKYGRTVPFESREKMKYITKLSGDKVIEILHQYQEAYGIFKYTFEREKDDVFIFTIDEIRQAYVYCGGSVKYRVVITPEPEGCVVWFILFESKSREAELRYAWEMKGFLEERIQAVRID